MDEKQTKEESPETTLEESRMPLQEHLRELRTCLVRAFIGVAAGFAVCYHYSQWLLDQFMAPLFKVLPDKSTAMFTGVAEAFVVHIKIALLAGFFISSPVWFYYIWRFVAPGLYPKEKLYALPFVFFSTVFFVGGAWFGFVYIFPYGFNFLINNYITADIVAQPKIDEYFSFATKLLIAFGLVFELPLVILFLARIGVVTARGMLRYAKFAVVLALVFGAILTPPDPITQVGLAVPIILLYLLGVLLAAIFGKRASKEEEAPEETGAAEKDETPGEGPTPESPAG